MKQEDKKLLLKDLCARLPYGVKIKTSYNKIDEPIELIFINPRNESFAIGSNFTITSGLSFDIYECKPYLFPLSSMTLEQRCKVRNLFPNNCDISFKNQKITFYDEGGSIQLDKLEKLFNFFNLWHIDYRGLIQMGLAIDATGLNIYSD